MSDGIPQPIDEPRQISPGFRTCSPAPGFSRAWLLVLLTLPIVAAPAGCDFAKNFSLFNSGENEGELARLEEKHREQYQTTRSKKSFRWLLANRLHPGMPYENVTHVLGEPGEIEVNSNWLKGKGTHLQVDDQMYRFGPDDQGNAVYLAFREGHLCNFEPEQFDSSKL